MNQKHPQANTVVATRGLRRQRNTTVLARR